MRFPVKKTHLLLILCGILIAYLLVNTGVFSDEFETRFTTNKQYYLDVPVLYLTHFIWYPLFDNSHQAVVNVLKILYIFLSFCMVSKFFKIYLDEAPAMLASFLFIFFPSHDATVYWFMGQYLTLSFAFYLFAFYLAYKNRLVPAFISGLIASFICYGSTPLALGLFILFLLNKDLKKAMIMLIPNIIYAAYFIPVNVFMRMGSPRIIEEFSFSALLKQFALQILTFFDAVLGPSMWLKVYYAFSQLSAISIAIGIAVIMAMYRLKISRKIDLRFVASFTIMLLLAFTMFASTGRYPQIAFNLGDRVTIYGSLLAAYLIAALPMPKAMRSLIIALLVFSIIGVSDHWKAWSIYQNTVIARIEKNVDLKNYKDARTIYVSGNQYSVYGRLSHIEFFSDGLVTACAFKSAFGDWVPTDTINRRFRYADGYLIDTKFGNKTKVDSYINVYDSEKDALLRIGAEDINKYIEALPADNRHWAQMVKVGFVKDAILRLMPRLKYAI